MPEGIAASLGIKKFSRDNCRGEALIGRFTTHGEKNVPGPQAYDDNFASLESGWQTVLPRIEKASDDDENKVPRKMVKNAKNKMIKTIDSIGLSPLLPGHKRALKSIKKLFSLTLQRNEACYFVAGKAIFPLHNYFFLKEFRYESNW